MSKFWVGLVLYCLLGAVLGAIGISAATEPVSFLCIMLIVILIDLNAKFNK